MVMKKGMLVMAGLALLGPGVRAQGPVSVIGVIVDKVVRAIDLNVQQLQTETIVLQNAEAVLQNAMSELQLDDIAEWVEDQENLYGAYFQELKDVKTVVSDYHKVRAIIQRQKDILAAYRRGMALFRRDPHFTAAELSQIVSVYGNILAESEKNLEQLTTVLETAVTSMTDEQRMTVIDEAGAGMDRDWQAVQVVTDENELMALRRARDINDYETLKKLYGL
jgi:hypothetical protein